MAAINGTALLLYSEGVVIAYQKGISITVETDLPDATNKESAGWAQHINGVLNAKIDFSALFSSSALPVMSANDLMNYILNRESMLISVLGLSFPIVGEADLSSLSFDAPLEGTMGLSGSLKVKGPLYCLTGLPTGYNAQLLTDPEGTNNSYDTHVISGTAITSAINIAGSADMRSNELSVGVTLGEVFKLITFFTKTSGELPTVSIVESGVAIKSNIVTFAEGLNIITLTITASCANVVLEIDNTAAANWAMSSIYLFKT